MSTTKHQEGRRYSWYASNDELCRRDSEAILVDAAYGVMT